MSQHTPQPLKKSRVIKIHLGSLPLLGQIFNELRRNELAAQLGVTDLPDRINRLLDYVEANFNPEDGTRP